MTDKPGRPEHEEPPSHYLDLKDLTDEELDRELTLNFDTGDPVSSPFRPITLGVPAVVVAVHARASVCDRHAVTWDTRR